MGYEEDGPVPVHHKRVPEQILFLYHIHMVSAD